MTPRTTTMPTRSRSRTFHRAADEGRAGPEREALARWLHDEPLQALDFIAYHATDMEQARHAAECAGKRLRAVVEARLELPHQPVELVSGLCDLVQESRDRGTTPVELRVGHMERTLTGERASTLLGAVREAVINAEKHAHAQHVEVSCEAYASCVYVWVRDDGVGIDPQHVRYRFGMPNSIIGRLEPLGGARILRGGRGGTVVEMHVDNPDGLLTSAGAGDAETS